MILVLGAASVSAAGQQPAATPVLVTNRVVVTNLLVTMITNRLVTTNLVVTTNWPSAAPPQRAKARKRSKPAPTLPGLDWVPPADTFDWVQLKSGEWLKGRIRALQERELDFESEELEDQTFEWKDIRQLRSPRTIDVLFIDGQLISGPVIVTPTQVAVGVGTPLSRPRDQLQSLTPGGADELSYWSGKAAMGVTLRAGNTEQVEMNSTLHLERRTPSTRLSLDYLGNFGSVDRVENVNNHRANAEFDLWLSRRLYLFLPFFEYYRDPLQNLDKRLTGAVGVGYDLIARPDVEWNVYSGPAYQYAWFESSQPGEPTERGAAALIFGTRLEWDITRRVEWTLEYRGQYTSREVGETTHHAAGILSLDVTHRLDLDVSLIWDRISQPKVGADGIAPKPDDLRLVVGLGIDF